MRQSLSAYSKCSDQELIDAAHNLNILIGALAAMGTGWSKDPDIAGGSSNVDVLTPDRVQELKRIVSPDIVDALRKCGSTKVGPILIKFGWRAVLVHWVCEVLDKFSFAALSVSGEPNQAANFMKGIWEDVQAKERQTVFSHWRSMTHRHIRSVVPEQMQESSQNAFRARMFEQCCIVASLGRNAPCSLLSHQDEFNSRAEEILQKALRLVIRIREDMATKNYEPMRPAPGVVFDEMSMKLDDKFAEDPRCKGNGARVACTIRLGLCHRQGGSDAAPTLVQKPEVVTQYAIAAMVDKMG